jgi:hypothetical protein
MPDPSEEPADRKRRDEDPLKRKASSNGASGRHAKNQKAGGDSNWPQFIPLGASERPNEASTLAPREARSAADLPRRISLGDLDVASFRATGKGWRATYRGDDPETFVELEYRKATPVLRINST